MDKQSSDELKIATKLANLLSQPQQQILLAIGKYPGIGAKVLAEKTHLSRYKALDRAKKLVSAKLVVAQMDDRGITGIKSGYYFYLAPEISLEIIKQSIQLKLDQKQVLSRKGVELLPPLTGTGSSEPEIVRPIPTDKIQLEQYLQQFPYARKCLLALTSNGATTFSLSQRIGIHENTVKRHLRQLYKNGWLERTKLYRVKGFSYFYSLNRQMANTLVVLDDNYSESAGFGQSDRLQPLETTNVFQLVSRLIRAYRAIDALGMAIALIHTPDAGECR